jgi:predicted RNA-binding protein with EMAP domain
VYAAMKNSSDILHWGKMLHTDDRKEFEKSMEKEVDGLKYNYTLDIEERISVPHHMKVIQTIWSFRRKRLPGDWSIQKWKSRLCPHGEQQVKGVN